MLNVFKQGSDGLAVFNVIYRKTREVEHVTSKMEAYLVRVETTTAIFPSSETQSVVNLSQQNAFPKGDATLKRDRRDDNT